MRFFSKAKRPGWLAMNLREDGLRLAHVKRDGSDKPVATMAAYYPNIDADLGELIARVNKEVELSRYHCSLLLDPGQYQFFTVDAPNVQPEEIKTAIRWRVKDMLDYRVDDAAIDVVDIPVDKEYAARGHSMFVVAARNQLIQEKITLFSESKVAVSVVDIPDMAQRNLSALMEPEGRAVAFLVFTSEGGLLTVSFQGELYLSRRIEVTQDDLATEDSDRRHALFDRVTLEVQRSLDHFDRQFHFITVARLVLAAGQDPGLENYMRSNLYLSVEPFELETVIDLSQCGALANGGDRHKFLMTLGAALRVEEKEL
ncbi:agglutinin biogenesis protein MshI [Noviherbaspirillum sp. ST9]|uniref:agglutinin biogenesis protein MshI n=1 Tax=Noviherbaspirillum sp. ST9 TaxID=3401606 RepID=UPI003B58663A